MSGEDRAAGYTDTEKKLAKKLKKLARDEGRDDFKHMRCLALIRKYKDWRKDRPTEEFISMVFLAETGQGE